MNNADENYGRGLKWKLAGGVPLEVFLSDGIWLGGLHGARAHQPFVAIAPREWQGEEEVSYFKNSAEVEDFIERLRMASRAAFTPLSPAE